MGGPPGGHPARCPRASPQNLTLQHDQTTFKQHASWSAGPLLMAHNNVEKGTLAWAHAKQGALPIAHIVTDICARSAQEMHRDCGSRVAIHHTDLQKSGSAGRQIGCM
eukprot:scaffold17688_cov17-Tisochrysis_lutea.AAC.1